MNTSGWEMARGGASQGGTWERWRRAVVCGAHRQCCSRSVHDTPRGRTPHQDSAGAAAFRVDLDGARRLKWGGAGVSHQISHAHRTLPSASLFRH